MPPSVFEVSVSDDVGGCPTCLPFLIVRAKRLVGERDDWVAVVSSQCRSVGWLVGRSGGQPCTSGAIAHAGSQPGYQ